MYYFQYSIYLIVLFKFSYGSSINEASVTNFDYNGLASNLTQWLYNLKSVEVNIYDENENYLNKGILLSDNYVLTYAKNLFNKTQVFVVRNNFLNWFNSTDYIPSSAIYIYPNTAVKETKWLPAIIHIRDPISIIGRQLASEPECYVTAYDAFNQLNLPFKFWTMHNNTIYMYGCDFKYIILINSLLTPDDLNTYSKAILGNLLCKAPIIFNDYTTVCDLMGDTINVNSTNQQLTTMSNWLNSIFGEQFKVSIDIYEVEIPSSAHSNQKHLFSIILFFYLIIIWIKN